jgi:hypothetical protein
MYAAPIHRCDFLRHAAAFGTALPFVRLGRAVAAQEPELVAGGSSSTTPIMAMSE